MDPPAKTDGPRACLDSDVLIAGLFSREGASHALLVLAEVGLLAVVVPVVGVEEVRRNLDARLPEARPLFEQFLTAPWVEVQAPTADALTAASALAHPKDAPILAAAMTARASLLVTHNARHFREVPGMRILRPGPLLREIRAWMTRFEG